MDEVAVSRARGDLRFRGVKGATGTQAPGAGKRDMPAPEGIHLNDEELEELVACVDSGLAADAGAVRTELADMLKQHAAKRQRGSPPEEQRG